MFRFFTFRSSLKLHKILLTACLCMIAVGAMSAGKDTIRVATYSPLSFLPPSMIKPDGWLKTYLVKQASQLGYYLPKVSKPFSYAYWEGEEKLHEKLQPNEYWWPWEQKGYWIDGALRCAILTGDSKLMQEASAPIIYTLTHPQANNYLGPLQLMDAKPYNYRWPHTIFFRAMANYAEYTGNKAIAEAMRLHYLSDSASYGTADRNVTNIESMLWSYSQTGDKRLLTMAENAWASFLKVATPGDAGDLLPDSVLANKPVSSHGVTYAEKSKLPAILYLYTGKKEYLQYAEAAQKRIFDRYMLVDGIPSTSEAYESITALDVHETCDIADHTWSWGYMLMATGDAIWADRIERACLNAGFGAIKKDWKGIQYLSGMNQVLSTLNSCHITNGGACTMAYQPNPATWVACCAGNAHRILPNYAMRMWMSNSQGGITAVLYAPGSVKTKVGKTNQNIEVTEVTNYPFEEKIQFIIQTERSVEFPFAMRIPAWCKSPRILLNDKPISPVSISKGFVVLNHQFKSGDIITLQLPMITKLSHWPENGIALEHGPLVYALPIKESWTSTVVDSEYCTAAFPRWEAKAASAWNYGLSVNDADFASKVVFQQKAMTDDPWVNPPVDIVVPARKVEGWDLVFDPSEPSRMFTPPLPDLMNNRLSKDKTGDYYSRDFFPKKFEQKAVKVSGTTEQITLVPYGSTQLRITIFPDCSKVK
jgi:uncharacterized protein